MKTGPSGDGRRTPTKQSTTSGSFVVVGLDGTFRTADAAKGQASADHSRPATEAAFAVPSPDGKRAAWIIKGPDGGDDAVEVVTADGGQPVRLRGHEGAVRTVRFSADGRTMVTGATMARRVSGTPRPVRRVRSTGVRPGP